LPEVCKDVHIQLYADDVDIYTHAKNFEKASIILSSAMTNVQDWTGLILNTKKKKLCMMFSKRFVEMTHSNVFLGGEEIEVVKEFTYLGVTLTFKSHVKKLSNIVKFNLNNFR